MAKNNIIQIAQLQARYSGTYEFTVTDTLDDQFYKYLARKLRDVVFVAPEHRHADVFPIDISLDDFEGDVVAGLAAFIHQDVLTIDLLWVGDKLRSKGIGKRMVQMAEEIAIQRGSQKARIRCAKENISFFVGLGYTITGMMQQLPVNGQVVSAQGIYWLTKTF
jgi:GNAT superfamily N-acetyltransferase